MITTPDRVCFQNQCVTTALKKNKKKKKKQLFRFLILKDCQNNAAITSQCVYSLLSSVAITVWPCCDTVY